MTIDKKFESKYCREQAIKEIKEKLLEISWNWKIIGIEELRDKASLLLATLNRMDFAAVEQNEMTEFYKAEWEHAKDKLSAMKTAMDFAADALEFYAKEPKCKRAEEALAQIRELKEKA